MQEFVETHYSKAVNIQNGIIDDNRMKIMIEKGDLDPDFVKKWMRDYGLFQGIRSDERENVVNIFCNEMVKLPIFDELTRDEFIEKYLKYFLCLLFKETGRTWLSAVTKMLWCKYPNKIVLYDSFVERAVTVLQWIYPPLGEYQKIGAKPPIRDGNVNNLVEFYMRYDKMVYTIFNQNLDTLNRLRQQYQIEYEHDIRIMDKLLWIMGSKS